MTIQEIQDLQAGDRFYFPGDPDYQFTVVGRVNAPITFIVCLMPNGELQRFYIFTEDDQLFLSHCKYIS